MATGCLPGFKPLLRCRPVMSQMHLRRRQVSCLPFRPTPLRSFIGSVSLACNRAARTCPPQNQTSSPADVEFWTSRLTWRRAVINTLRCLVGCSVGDFSTMWYLQVHHPGLDIGTTMALASKPQVLHPNHSLSLTLNLMAMI